MLITAMRIRGRRIFRRNMRGIVQGVDNVDAAALGRAFLFAPRITAH
jgi:hypothetical protein